MLGRPEASSPPARETGSLAGVTTRLGRIQTGNLERHRELVGRAPPLRDLLSGGHHLPLQALDLARLVDGKHMDSKLLVERSHALAMGRSHPRRRT
jgi:hypothetical protein